MRWIAQLLTCTGIPLAMLVATLAVPTQAGADAIPTWLQKHVGTGAGQIAPVVLERARALYQDKLSKGEVRNPCYFAKDATRPHGVGSAGARFYIICEQSKTFRAVSSGHGNGRKLPRATFANGRECAQHFSNAEGSKLTMGGAYVTAETRTSFKGYVRQSGQMRAFKRTFILFDGERETRNARERAIGGHEARFLRWQCRMNRPQSPHADAEGFVPVGKLVDYTGGRSNGCTTWSDAVSDEIIEMVEDNPTSLYIYPESKDIEAVTKAVQSGKSPEQAGTYWNASCLRAIGAPKFWSKQKLQPVINQWRASLPKQAPLELPICK